MNAQTDEEAHEEIARLYAVNLKRLRKMRKLSQLDLACDADMGVTYVNDIENRKRNVSARALNKLAKALQVEPYQLLLPEHIADNGLAPFIADFNEYVLAKMEQITSHYLSADHEPQGLNKPRKKKEVKNDEER